MKQYDHLFKTLLMTCMYLTSVAATAEEDELVASRDRDRNRERPSLYDQIVEEDYPDKNLYKEKDYYHYDCEEYCEESGFPINYPSIIRQPN